MQAGVGNVPGIAHVSRRALSVMNPPHLLDVAFALFGSEPDSFLGHRGLHKTEEDRVDPDVSSVSNAGGEARCSDGISRPAMD
jgi:hypothetical protein